MTKTSTPALAERLKTAMTARKLKQAQLSKLVGEVSGFPISQVAIQKITSGQTQHSKRLPDIARALGVSVEWLAYGSDDSRFPESSTTLHPVGETTAQSSDTDTEERKLKRGLVPVTGILQMGDDGYFDEKSYPDGRGAGFLKIHSDDPDAYGLKVLGDHLSPRIKHGEYVVIEPNQAPIEHEEVLVKTVDGRRLIKVYSELKDDFYRFESINENRPPMHMPANQIEAVHFIGGILKGARFFVP